MDITTHVFKMFQISPVLECFTELVHIFSVSLCLVVCAGASEAIRTAGVDTGVPAGTHKYTHPWPLQRGREG